MYCEDGSKHSIIQKNPTRSNLSVLFGEDYNELREGDYRDAEYGNHQNSKAGGCEAAS